MENGGGVKREQRKEMKVKGRKNNRIYLVKWMLWEWGTCLLSAVVKQCLTLTLFLICVL